MRYVSGKMRLRLRAITVAAVLALFLADSCTKKSRDPAAAAPVPVLAATAEIRDVLLTLSEIGTVEAINAVAVASRVGGQLMRVAFNEGQDVTKGEVLFLIDPAPYEAALNQAIDNFKHDSIAMVNAERNANRYKELSDKDFATKQEFESFAAIAAEARTTAAADQALIKNARLNLGYCTILAPISGRTGNLIVTRGNLIAASPPVTLVTINQISPIYVRFALPEARLGEIRRRERDETLSVWAIVPEDSVKITDGKLTFIDNAADPATGTILLKAIFPNANHVLWPGQFVHVGLVLGKMAGAVVVPATAIQTSQQGIFLYVIMAGDTVQLRPIVAGTTADGMTVIERGVLPGEKVVIDGMMQLRQGLKISIKSGLAPVAAKQEARKR